MSRIRKIIARYFVEITKIPTKSETDEIASRHQ